MDSGEVKVVSVDEVLKRSGKTGNVSVVRVSFLNTHRSIHRTVKGPVQKEDLLALLEHERDSGKHGVR